MISVAIKRRLGEFTLDVAFEGAANGVTALFGPSGAGKSATLAAIAGSGMIEAGRIVLGDRVLFDHGSRVNVPPRARRIGWVFQDARLFPHLRVDANLRYGLKRAPGPHRIGFDQVVATLDIGHLLRRGVRDLSGGERQRIALGRALLSQPELLLLDEPLAALDGARKDEILAYIARLKADFALPMLYVTHSPDEVRAVADHVVMLEHGRVVATGGPSIVGGDRITARIVARDRDGVLIRVPRGDVTTGDRLDLLIDR
ncbi:MULTISPECIES: molybdenum ABC transporter ATP-binding protein [unclassified Sphingomonas]|uniref:molybdenum ABC transporter ATP-binding protein n=1 Tax=unclassified Sphingomonas TaxID=196159 RepID=UPI001F5AF05B|nr:MULTISPECIES: molybdenum ABC transporter ATP-binding protein [unclassified Sphingomonas]